VYDLLNELKYAKYDTTKADIFLSLAQEYYPTDVTKAIGKAELALVIATNKDDVSRKFKALTLLIDANYQLQNLNLTARFLSQAQALSAKNLSVEQKAILFGLEGKVFLLLEDFEKAQKAFQQQLKIYEGNPKWENSAEIAKIYFALGELNFIQNAPNDAITFFLKASKIINNTDDVHSRVALLNALGKTYLHLKDYQKGLQYVNDALYLSESLSDKKLVGDLMLTAASAHHSLGQQEEAIAKINQSLALGESIGNQYLLAKAKLMQGKIYEQSNKSKDAPALFQEALHISWLANNKTLTKDIYEALYQYYDGREDTKNAYFYLKGLVGIRDSLKAEERSKEFIINKIKFETEEKEAANQKLVALQLANEVTIQRQRMSNYILIILLLVVCAGGYGLQQSLKKKKANNQVLGKEVERRAEELRLSNESLLDSNRKLEQSNAELERFAYIASHDLKSPLRNIISFMNLIERKLKNSEDKDIKEYLRFVTENAMQMNTLIQDVLEFSRVETEINQIRVEKIDLNDTLMLAVQNLQENLQESGAEIVCGKLPTIYANSVHFLQLLQNIVGNAIKYNQATQPKIMIQHKEINNQHILSIEDNGIGIAPQYHEQIFEMFKRLHTKEEYKGTGIGLAICKKVVNSFGGKIWLESEVGKGSIFFVSIPIENKRQLSVVA
jgi:signal transduction histidine kinase